MKKLFLLCVLVGLAAQARAQLFSPESFSGAAFGAVTGAIIGGHHAGEAAAIGAGAGFLAGTLLHEAQREAYYAPYRYGYGPYGYPAYSGYPYYVSPPYAPPPAVTQVANAPSQQQQPVPALRPQPPPSAMSSANNLFGR